MIDIIIFSPPAQSRGRENKAVLNNSCK